MLSSRGFNTYIIGNVFYNGNIIFSTSRIMCSEVKWEISIFYTVIINDAVAFSDVPDRQQRISAVTGPNTKILR